MVEAGEEHLITCFTCQQSVSLCGSQFYDEGVCAKLRWLKDVQVLDENV